LADRPLNKNGTKFGRVSKLSSLLQLLQAGLKELNLDLPITIQEKIIHYVELLHKWNKTYNLTSSVDQKTILIRHILDSLAITSFIVGPNILDLGTGAGLPGIPLALALPQHQFILLDSTRKKTTFLNHIKILLEIENINIINKRIEDYISPDNLATIVTRATSAIDNIIELTKYLCTEETQILIMKGKYPTKELNIIKQLLELEVYCIKVPYLAEDRNLVKILPKGKNCDCKNHSHR
jgi:16S rRNA (guanine527-N7)-methyltransferase